ncbi:hypothetical protein HDK64DRAFT_317619 [Phyllosticta capitalensis]
MHFRLPSITALFSHVRQKDSTLETLPTNSQNRLPRPFKKDGSDTHGQTVQKLWTAAYEDSRSDMCHKFPLLVEQIEKNSARFPAELPDWLAETKIKCNKHDFRRRFEQARPDKWCVSAGFDHAGGLFDQANDTRRDLALLKSVFATETPLADKVLKLAVCLYEKPSGVLDATENTGKLFFSLALVHSYRDAKLGGIFTEKVYNALRDTYDGLFEFFFEAYELIQEPHFRTNSLPQDAEIWRIIKRIQDDRTELSQYAKKESEKILVENAGFYLGTFRMHDEAFEKHTSLEGAERSFRWIHSDPKLRQWLQDDTRFLVMSGPSGCGKTLTTLYFVNHLRQEEERNELKTAMVCAFFDEDMWSIHDRMDTTKVLSSLILQIVEKKPDLWTASIMTDFCKSHPKPTRNRLIDLLQSFVEAARCPIFVLIDYHDSRPSSWPEAIMKDLMKVNVVWPSKFKVFVSSQNGASLNLPDDQYISMTHDCSPQRDRAIAEYLVKKELSKESTSIDCHRPRFSPEALVEMLCDFPGRIALYPRVILCANKVLQYAIEFLAVAKRPLKLVELRWALSKIDFHKYDREFWDGKFGITWIRDFDMEWIFERIGPALQDHVHEQPSGALELVDKASILKRESTAGSDVFEENVDDSADIHGLLARACLRYLTSSDFSESFFDVEVPATDAASAAGLAAAHDFYDYAAWAWIYHVAKAGSSSKVLGTPSKLDSLQSQSLELLKRPQ